MHFPYTRVAQAIAALGLALPAHAQTTEKPPAGPAVELPPVVVTGNPLGSELFDLVAPTSVLFGTDLDLARTSTLGETLNQLPGVSSTYFGPNASRPVIRGLDSDRIRILENGVGVLDASALSYDHAVTVDPLIIDRAEVVRGPAAVLYGGNAVGGVVNTVNNRIPQAPIAGPGGRAEARFGGAEREKAAAGVFEAGNGRFALHADAYYRDTDDLRIAGANVSPQLQAQDPTLPVTYGTLPNSASRSEGGALGASYTWAKGYVGASFSNFDANYGTVAEPEVTINMRSNKVDVAGEARELGSVITALKFKVGNTDYKHTEYDAGAPATNFSSRGYNARLELAHGKLGPLSGAFGAEFVDFDFSATGAEAFLPSSTTRVNALFLYEELPVGRFKFTFGGRYEKNDVSSGGGGPTDPNTGAPRFDPPTSNSYTPLSGAVGALYSFTPNVALAVNASYTERAPTFFELYSNGPHAATGAYEIGNSNFSVERSRSIDIALRGRSGPHSGSIGWFQNRFDNFIGLFNTGLTRGADGELNPPDTMEPGVSDNSGEEILPEYAWMQVPAKFRGFEAQGRVRAYQGTGALDVVAQYDYLWAENTATGVPLPRIAPQRFRLGLDYRYASFGVRLDNTWVSAQNRVSTNELPTDSYAMLNLALTWRVNLPMRQSYADLFLRGTNLLNEDARNAVSIIKDIAPLGARAAQVGVRAVF